MGFHDAAKAMIVVGSKVPPPIAAEFTKEFPELDIYDIDNLANLAAPHTDLARRLDALLRDALPFSDYRQPEPQVAHLQIKPSRPPTRLPRSASPRGELAKGVALCVEIERIPPGKDDAKHFEDKVTEALEYVFEGDLAAWAKQSTTGTQISIYDVIARIASNHDFWKSMTHHFHSRYVVFELKNYGLKIKQGQIYTTEKYLYRTALRSIAIIVSKKGADKNGLAAARGALREHGKLIINLTVADLCKMLHLKDSGDDHNSVLVDIVDDMLRKLER